MKNLKTKPFVYFIFTLFAICFTAIALIRNEEIVDIWSTVKIAYKTIPILLILWLGFTKYAWKWSVFQGWLVPFPYIEGTWQGNIQTTWKNPKTGEIPGPIPVILTIKQSFSRISCVMRTAEMTSSSHFADFWLDSDEQLRKLGYCYVSNPSVSVAERSQPHQGTIVLDIIGNPVNKLRGTYWTSRKTTGEVELIFHYRERLDEYPNYLGEHPMKDQ
jgi:hypothetical protein